jgi:hypothetical protein
MRFVPVAPFEFCVVAACGGSQFLVYETAAWLLNVLSC